MSGSPENSSKNKVIISRSQYMNVKRLIRARVEEKFIGTDCLSITCELNY